jgi:hypothetical protein
MSVVTFVLQLPYLQGGSLQNSLGVPQEQFGDGKNLCPTWNCTLMVQSVCCFSDNVKQLFNMRWVLTKTHTTQPVHHRQNDDPQEGANAENIKHSKGENENQNSLYCHYNKLRYHM